MPVIPEPYKIVSIGTGESRAAIIPQSAPVLFIWPIFEELVEVSKFPIKLLSYETWGNM